MWKTSRSLRARGLKWSTSFGYTKISQSRSLRARGLKWLDTHVACNTNCVALFTGAWIEIGIVTMVGYFAGGRALYGRVD